MHCAFLLVAGVKSPPPTNAHLHPEETPAQIICRAEHCHRNKGWCNGRDLQLAQWLWRCEDMGDWWGLGEREAHLVPVQQAVIHRHKPPAGQKSEVNRGHLAGRPLPHYCFSGLQCCSLWWHWNVQSAEFLMRSGQKYNASCPYSELISYFGLCRDSSSTFISF